MTFRGSPLSELRTEICNRNDKFCLTALVSTAISAAVTSLSSLKVITLPSYEHSRTT